MQRNRKLYTVKSDTMRVEHVELVLNSVLAEDPNLKKMESVEKLRELSDELYNIQVLKPWYGLSARILEDKINNLLGDRVNI